MKYANVPYRAAPTPTSHGSLWRTPSPLQHIQRSGEIQPDGAKSCG